MQKNFTQTLRNLLLTAVCMATCATIQAVSIKTTYIVKVQRTVGQDVSRCAVYPEALLKTLGSSATSLGGALASDVKLWAVQPSGRYYSSSTYGIRGHCFNANGAVVTKTSKKRAIYTDLDTSKGLLIGTVDSMLTEGTVYTVREALINSSTADTVLYEIQVSLGSTSSVESNEPSFAHRADIMDSWIVRPYVQQNDQAGEYTYCLQVNAGDRATIGARPLSEGQTVRTYVKNPVGKVVKTWSAKDYELTSVETTDAGAYTVMVRVLDDATGKIIKSAKYTYYLDVQTEQGQFYNWKDHTTVFSYNYTDEFPDGFPQPAKSHNILKQDGTAANRIDGDWWCAYWGDNLNSEVDGNNKHAFTNMVEKFDTDFAYIRDVMGWPPDANIQNGWRSYIYTFGSGLANDNTANTEQGGYQSAAYVDNGSWVCVWASYYPVSRFRDDADQKWSDGSYQREAMIHEGLHAVLATMNGCKEAAWFQESGNTWLQAKMTVQRSGKAGDAGFLDGTVFIAPFMPVECYSGWLQDGSFGGPSAEGVNMYTSSGQQVCTWRSLLGGAQYANGFGIFLGEAVGNGAVPWIWRYAKGRVLEGIATGSEGVDGIGDEATRSLILQYRAKQATFDLNEFSNSYRTVTSGNFGGTVGPEWEPYNVNCAKWKMTPYAPMTKNDAEGWLAPDTLTNPGWSGGNQIPIHVSGNHCEVFFRPEDTNMRAQLCYRTKDGQCYYSQPVLCGKMELNWDENSAPANNVIFAVVANTDYKYTGESQRKHHYDYRIKLGDGALAVASKDIKWFMWEQTLRDTDFETSIESIQGDATQNNHTSAQGEGNDLGIRITSSVLHAGGTIQFDLGTNAASDIVAHLTGFSGVMIDAQPMSANGTIRLPHTLPNGMYILTLARGNQQQSYKVFVK